MIHSAKIIDHAGKENSKLKPLGIGGFGLVISGSMEIDNCIVQVAIKLSRNKEDFSLNKEKDNYKELNKSDDIDGVVGSLTQYKEIEYGGILRNALVLERGDCTLEEIIISKK